MDEIRDRNVYILGAGFSQPAGVPVIHDFIMHCVLHYHAWRMCRDLEEGAVINSF